jgi:hypothetical protein
VWIGSRGPVWPTTGKAGSLSCIQGTLDPQYCQLRSSAPPSGQCRQGGKSQRKKKWGRCRTCMTARSPKGTARSPKGRPLMRGQKMICRGIWQSIVFGCYCPGNESGPPTPAGTWRQDVWCCRRCPAGSTTARITSGGCPKFMRCGGGSLRTSSNCTSSAARKQ